MLTTADKRAAFRKLHESGCFIIPNPFDVGSAVALQHLGFKALASTSAGFAWTIAKPDNRVTVDDVCTHLAAICAAVDLPVNADFEDGFAHEPEKVGINVGRAVKTGVAGLSIEDAAGKGSVEIAELSGREIVIDEDEVGLGRGGDSGDFLNLSSAEQGGRIGTGSALDELGGDCRAGAQHQLAKLSNGFLRVEPRGDGRLARTGRG